MPEPTDPPPNALFATELDLSSVELESPLQGAEEWTCEDFRGRFGSAAKKAEESGDGAAERVYRSLAVLCSFWPNYDDPTQPYRPEYIDYGEGRRTSVPDDLTATDLDLVEVLFDHAQDPALRARLGDVLFLHRRLREVWPLAVAAYAAANS